MKTCPKCNTKSLNSALICDCGFHFLNDGASGSPPARVQHVTEAASAPVIPTSDCASLAGPSVCRKSPQWRPAFEVFLIEQSTQNPRLSLEELLTDYIARYRLSVRKSLDEPESISAARTRLHILEETPFVDSSQYSDDRLQAYIAALRSQVSMGDKLHPDILAAMKERERRKI